MTWFPQAVRPNEGRYKRTVRAWGTEGWNAFPHSAGLFLLGVQHKQGCILADRLSVVEEAVLALVREKSQAKSKCP